MGVSLVVGDTSVLVVLLTAQYVTSPPVTSAASAPTTQLKRCVDKLSKSTYPSLAHITVFLISGLQSVIY